MFLRRVEVSRIFVVRKPEKSHTHKSGQLQKLYHLYTNLTFYSS